MQRVIGLLNQTLSHSGHAFLQAVRVPRLPAPFSMLACEILAPWRAEGQAHLLKQIPGRRLSLQHMRPRGARGAPQHTHQPNA